MRLTRLCIERPIVAWIGLAAIAIVGVLGYSKLPVELHPRVDIPTLTVVTVLPGAAPADVEELVTRPIEQAVGTAPGLRGVYSSSQNSVSVVGLDFSVGVDLDSVTQHIRERVDAIVSDLPQGAQRPTVARLDINAQPVIYAAITAHTSSQELRAILDDRLAPDIARTDGVAGVTVVGGLTHEIQVRVDPSLLALHQLTIDDVANAVRAAGQAVPAGTLTDGSREVDVRTLGQYGSLADIGSAQIILPKDLVAGYIPALPIPGLPLPDVAAQALTVRDVADISDAVPTPTRLSRLNGLDCVALVVTKTQTANAVAVADAVRAKLRSARTYLPAGAQVVVARDESRVIRDALQDVNATILLGAILATLIVFLFLRNLRGTVIVALTLPACVLATFAAMHLAGFALNQMTLLALSLSIGILVDDSIVVLESITRHLSLGEEAAEAAFNGRTEIGFAGIALTLSDVVVFVPIAFMSGIVGAFFREFGLTVAFATLFSLLVSFTLTPTLAAAWYRRSAATPSRRTPPWQALVETRYRSLLRRAIAGPGWVVAFCTVALAAVLLVTTPMLGYEFLPASDQGQIGITVETQPGASLAITDGVVREVERRISPSSDVAAVLSTIGEIVGGFGAIPQRGSQFAQVTVKLRDRPGAVQRLLGLVGGSSARVATDESVATDLRNRIGSVKGATIAVAPVRTVANVGAPLQVEVLGDDLNDVIASAQDLARTMRSTNGIADVQTSVRVGSPELRIVPDRARCAQLGLPPALAADILRKSIAGTEAARLVGTGPPVPIKVMLPPAARTNPDAVLSIPVGAAGNSAIRLGDVVTSTIASSPTSIERVNGRRAVTVSGNLAPGYALGNVRTEVEHRLSTVLRSGVTARFGGEAGVMEENLPHMAMALTVAVLLVYLTTAALFNSFGTPLIMLTALPMALIGAFAGLALTHQTLSLVSMVGVIMLVGLMGRNAILLIDYCGTLRARGCALTDAVVEAGATRLRPILMTTLTTVFGMLPVALRIGRASELRAPMAVVVIGGLLVSTILTLLVVPAVYVVAHRPRNAPHP